MSDPTRSPLSVLVADDSADLRDLITMVIDRHANDWHVVGHAVDGQTAIDQARSTRPDLVLLDIAMPVIDGIEALPQIREAVPEAVVIMLSGYPFSIAGERSLKAGAHGYIEKGSIVASLVTRVEEILEDVRGS